jgi:hypothetical protein
MYGSCFNAAVHKCIFSLPRLLYCKVGDCTLVITTRLHNCRHDCLVHQMFAVKALLSMHSMHRCAMTSLIWLDPHHDHVPGQQLLGIQRH